MAAGVFDFVLEQGATFTRTITWKDSLGVGINLTGYTIAGKIKRKISDHIALLPITVTISDQGVNPGQFVISLTATQTTTLPSEEIDCPYDIEATNGATVYRVLQGKMKLNPEVTD